MCSTRFGNITPRLEAGVVLEREGKYWLCIQPLCDSVRMEPSRKFPILPLLRDNDKGRKSETVVMIRALDGSVLPVRFSLSPYAVSVPEFASTSGKSSVLAKRKGQKWYFEDIDKKRYYAVCRLRNEFTQQAVHGLVSGVARPGVDSSEWLRRQSR